MPDNPWDSPLARLLAQPLLTRRHGHRVNRAGVLAGIAAMASTPRTDPGGKVAKTWPNVANGIANWLTEKWPELRDIAGLWFTGSSVWSHLYNSFPPRDADLDIFVTPVDGVLTYANEAINMVADKLGVRVVDGRITYLGARRWQVPGRGQVDFWVAAYPTPQAQLAAYPSDSHAHCRAAFSYTAGLVVLPNEKAI